MSLLRLTSLWHVHQDLHTKCKFDSRLIFLYQGLYVLLMSVRGFLSGYQKCSVEHGHSKLTIGMNVSEWLFVSRRSKLSRVYPALTHL